MRSRIFDMDGVFYNYTPQQHKHFIHSMAMAGIRLGVDLPYEKAAEVALDSFLTHKYGGHRFVHEHNICPQEMCFAYDDTLDLAVIEPDVKLLSDFREAALKHPAESQVILTQSTDRFANRLLAHLGIRDLFGAVICLNHSDFKLKSNSPVPFERALEALGADAKETDMIEDTIANLVIPKDMGMRAIFINHGKPLPELPDFVDVQVAQPADVYKLDY